MTIAVRKIFSPHSPAVLQALQYQGQSNDCGPYTTATILNALRGANLNGIELAQHMNQVSWRRLFPVIRRIPNWATFPWGIADVLLEYGLKASWKPLASEEHLRQALEKGHVVMPIIGSWRPLWAHVMTLLAWDQQDGWGFANTQFDDHRMFWMSPEEFSKKWKALGRLLVEARVS